MYSSLYSFSISARLTKIVKLCSVCLNIGIIIGLGFFVTIQKRVTMQPAPSSEGCSNCTSSTVTGVDDAHKDVTETNLVAQYQMPLPQKIHIELSSQLMTDCLDQGNKLYIEEIGSKQLFIIGDVHGCLEELKELLTIANVTPDNAILLFCGDLVNQGPKSLQTLSFIRSLGSSALSVRGNHDEWIVYKRLNLPTTDSDWDKDLSDDDVTYLRDLPYTISVPSHNLIVVHAGLMPGVLLQRQRPLDMTTMRNVLTSETPWRAVEDMKLGGVAWGGLWRGPQHVYFGHEALGGKQTYEHATGLDTAVLYGGRLTGVSIMTPGAEPRFFSVAAHETYYLAEK